MNNFLSNPRVFVLLISLIIVAGLSALQSLPRNEDPRTANRNAIVLTEFPGASAQRVEALVSEPLEKLIREMPEVEHVDSRSSAGFSSMSIELVDEVGKGQTDEVWSELRDKLEKANALLPAGAGKPVAEERRSYPFTIIVALTWAFDSEPNLMVLGRYAEELESRMRRLTGVDFVDIQGSPEEEIVVDVDGGRAAALGLHPHYIGEQVFMADAKNTAGEIHNNRMRVGVEVEGALDSLERIRRIPLRQLPDGNAIMVGDVAQISRQPQLPQSDLAVVSGKPAVTVGVRMLPDQRSDLWSAKVRQELENFSQQLPANVAAEVIFDQENYTAARLTDLIANIIIGFVLIVIVLLITLGWRASLVVATALPLTVLFALACMNFTGLPIHQMSVTGLIVALGIMVDNAIVMTDTVNRNKQAGMGGLEATQRAVQHLWLPLLGSTITTMLAFMPILIMPGGASEFVGAIATTVIFSLLGSYIISNCIVAGLAGRFLQQHRYAGWWQDGVRAPALAKRFKTSIAMAMARPAQVIVLVLLLPLLGFFLGSTLPEQFFPPSDRDMLSLELYLPAASSIEQTLALTKQVTAEFEQEPGLKSLHWFVGRNAPMYYYNLKQGNDDSQYYAQAMLTADNFIVANKMVAVMQRRLDDKFPQVQIVLRRLEQGPPFGAPVELRILGPDLNVLKTLGDELRADIMGVTDVVHVRNSLSEAVPKVWLAVDENQAMKARLGLRDVASQLHEVIDGAISGSVLEGTQSLPVRVKAGGQKQIDIGSAHSWFLIPEGADADKLQSSRPIPYSSLGEIDIRPELGVIARRDGERVNTLQVYIRDGQLPAVVLKRVKAMLQQKQLHLPAGYRLETGGEDAKRSEAVGKLMSSLGLIVVLLIVAVVMSFNSFRLSAVIFLTALQAAGMGMLALAVSGAPFGFTSIIGLMGLIGLAINAAIVILAELKSSPQAVAGDQQAIVTCVVNCSRHIISTTITTVMGFLPLILSGGGFWPPFAFVIAGGTVLTTVISFYFVPIIFYLMTRKRQFALTAVAA